MNTGFTLIELLVVVLIIGVLAAVALPQYQKAVEKARMAEVAQFFSDFATAQELYYAQHGTYANSEAINHGDITLTIPSNDGAYYYYWEELDDSMTDSAYELVASRQGGSNSVNLSITKQANESTIHKYCTTNPGGSCALAATFGFKDVTPVLEP